MSLGNRLSIVALAAMLGGLIVPAFAQNNPGGTQGAPDQGMSMGHMGQGQGMGMGHMGQGMMQGGMMSRGMMGGCSEMMQSMNNGGGGPPNSQWHKHSSGDAMPD